MFTNLSPNQTRVLYNALRKQRVRLEDKQEQVLRQRRPRDPNRLRDYNAQLTNLAADLATTIELLESLPQ
jgi:hypothetical protein